MSTRSIPRWAEATALLALLAAWLLLTLPALPHKSASFDEQFHLTAGYSYLKTGDARLATTHPPLAGLIAALPLLRDPSIVLPLDHPTWQQANRFDFSDHFLWYANDHGPALVQRARVPLVLLGLLLIVAIHGWARRLVGPGAALLAAALATFDPNLLANARQVTTDFGVTLFLFLTFWRLWCWLEAGRRWDLVAAGLLAGAAMGSKYNGLLLWPAVALVLLLHPPRPGDAHVGWRRIGALLGMGALALAVLWTLYRFSFGPATVAGVTVPLPAPHYWSNLWATVGGLLDEGAWKPDFLLGRVGTEGWWYYFPVAIAIKTPLPLLILLGGGVTALVRFGGGRRQAAVWTPPLLFLALALTGILTIGYRHLLPALPFVCLLAANTMRWLERATLSGVWRARVSAIVLLFGLLIGWLIGSAVWFFPHHDSYFNELAGRPVSWSNLLVDSNLDWGQDLPALRAVMAERGIERVNLAYFGKAVPEKYGVSYSPLPGYLRFMGGREPAAFNPVAPEAGWYAISATSLRLGTLQPDTVDLYAWFRTRTPDARAGYSIALYNVPPSNEPARDRVIIEEPVWRSAAVLDAAERLQARWVQSAATAIIPASAFVEAAGEDDNRIGADLGGVFVLEGYTLEPETPRPGDLVRMTLDWRRGRAPMPMPAPTRGEPISAFVHLTTDDPGDVRTQFDGWEVALRGLLPGDRIVQPVELILPPDLPPGEYRLRVGLYSPQNGERLTTITANGVQNSIDIGALTVTP